MAKKKIKNESKVFEFEVGNGVKASIQLVNIIFCPEMSDETLAFTSGLKVVFGAETFLATCKNNGCGGSTDIDIPGSTHCHRQSWRAILNEIDEYFGTQDDVEYVETCKEYGWPCQDVPKMSLESKVNSMLAHWADENNL